MTSAALKGKGFAGLPGAWLVSAGIVLGLSMGVRHVQGLFMLPMLLEHGWSRASFSFALGLQVLVWGVVQTGTGYLADRFGSARIIAGGCVLYGAGLLIEALAGSTAALSLGAGVVTGLGLTATTFAVVYGALSRLVPDHLQGTAFGIAGGIGGGIQFVLVPLCQMGIDRVGWSGTLQLLALCLLLAAGAGWFLDDRATTAAASPHHAVARMPVARMIRAACGHSGFWLLNLGFVSCGFQLAFLGAHLPAYLKDAGMGTSAGVHAIALIALANAMGTYAFGRLGDMYRRKYVLSALYTIRTLAMLAFLLLPLSNASLYAFAGVMGATWLGTVPLTSGILAQIFGVRYLGTLFGLVFLGHQLGGFLGAWLGGIVYDTTHSYAHMWAISLALGIVSIVINLPIRDRSVAHTLRPAAG